MGLHSEEHIKLMQGYQHDSDVNYESRFWTEMYLEQRKKIEFLKKELQKLNNKCKECGIGNDHKA
tara:strand:- start:318 stop:512 length:195 start_codon:yes stop_codon:yes gene_type:complete